MPKPPYFSASNPGSKFYTSAKWSQLHWNYENAAIPDKDFSLDNILAGNVLAGTGTGIVLCNDVIMEQKT